MKKIATCPYSALLTELQQTNPIISLGQKIFAYWEENGKMVGKYYTGDGISPFSSLTPDQDSLTNIDLSNYCTKKELSDLSEALNNFNEQLDGKAAKATTLGGYNIEDAYNKSTIDNIVHLLQGSIIETNNNVNSLEGSIASKATQTEVNNLKETINNFSAGDINIIETISLNGEIQSPNQNKEVALNIDIPNKIS
jgi:hypothetical protein